VLFRLKCQVLHVRKAQGQSESKTTGLSERWRLFAEDLWFFVEVVAEGEALDEHAEDVFEGEVRLLDVHGDGRGDDDVVVAEGAHVAAVVAGEGDGGDADDLGLSNGSDEIFGVAGGRDGEEDVAGLAEGFELTGEEVVEAVVVACGGEDRRVGGEGDGAEGRAVDGEADDELGDEVLRVGGGATVAGDEELVAGFHGLGGELGDGDESFGDGFVGEDGLHGGDGLSELLLNQVLHEFSGGACGADARVRDGWGGCRRWERWSGEVFRVGCFRG